MTTSLSSGSGHILLYFLIAILLWTAHSQKICKRFICSTKDKQPPSQINDTFCLNEQNTAKDLFKVFVYPDMCQCIPFFFELLKQHHVLANQYCSYYSILEDNTLSETIYSVCRNNSAPPLIYPATVSYPGEACDTYGVLYTCPYGKKLYSLFRVFPCFSNN